MKNKKGFTLIEVLAIIVLIAIVFSITFLIVNNVNDSAKEETIQINENSILAAANIYTEEFNKNLNWRSNDEETMVCVSVEEIVNQGMLEKDKVGTNYEEYVVKVIKSDDDVNSYHLMKKRECKILDTKPPVINGENVEIEIKDDYDVYNDVKIDGTGSEIINKNVTLDGEKITNTKNLDLGEYILIYTAEDEGNNSVEFTRTIKIVDTKKPDIISLEQVPVSSNNNWQKGNIKVTGKAKDTGSGIQSYLFSKEESVDKNNVNWKNLTSAEEEITQYINSSDNGKLYFHVKDRAGNISSKEIQLYIDNIAPTFVSKNGNISLNSIPMATFKDDQSGIKEVKYYISTISTKPDKNNKAFSTSKDISMSCRTSYYAWAIGIDKAGNISEVESLGSYYRSCSSGGSSGGSSSSSSNSSSGSSCDVVCQMQKNSEAWHNATSQKEKDELHKKNEELAQQLPGSSFNQGNGTWNNSSGKPIYSVSDSDKKKSSSSSKTSKGR